MMSRKRIWTAILAGALIAMSGAAMAESYDWQTIPLQGGGFVDGFLYHPKKAGILYARTDVGGMYRYDYTHARWIPLMDGFGKADWDCMGVMTMAVDPQKPERLYATCGLYLNDRAPNGAVVRSENMGATWAITRLPFKLGGNAMGRGTGERLQVDPADSNTIWLGTNQDGLWVSHDQGKRFARSAYAQKSVTVVLIRGQTIYAGSGEVGEGLFKSTDGGQTFVAVAGSPKMIPHQMALGKDGTLYVTFSDNLGPHGVTDGAVWKLKGDVWTDISPAKPSKSLTFGYSGLDLSPDGALVVSTSDRYPGLDDLYISHDGGAHWKPVKPQAVHHTETHPWLIDYMGGHDQDAANRNNMGHWMDAVKINPFNPNELLYGTGYGVWMTDNLDALDKGGKVDFHFRNDNFEETVVLGLESPPVGPRVLMAAGDVGGTAFDDFSRTPQHGLFSPMNKTNQSVAFAALKPNIIVRSVDNETAHGYISTDGAGSWTPLNAPAPLMTTDWHNHRAGKLAISAEGKAMVWVPEGEGAYHSDDLGRTWTLSTGWPKPERGQEAIADKVNDAVFYSFDRATGMVLTSRDGGASFAPLYQLTAGQGQLRAVPGHEGDLWLAAGTALYHGEKVVAGVDAAWQVTFGQAAPGKDYPAVFLWGKVGGIEGLWRSDDAGVDWLRINDDAHRFGQMRAIAGDPREYGALYISPDGRGTMVGRAK
jgi:hypothetical protein